MIIDFHTHIGWNKNKTLISNAESLNNELIRAGVDYAVVFALNSEDACYEEFNNLVLKFSEECSKVVPFMRLRPSINVEEFVKERVKKFKGIKYHPKNRINKQGFEKILKTAQAFKLPLLIHSNDEIIKEFKPLILEHSGVKVIAAHATSSKNYLQAYKQCSNLYYESSIKMSPLSMKRLARVDNKRLLFGSDYPFSTPLIEKKRIELTPSDYLSDKSKKLMLGLNAKNLLKL